MLGHHCGCALLKATTREVTTGMVPNFPHTGGCANRSCPQIKMSQPCPKIEREEGDHPLQTGWTVWYDRKQSKKTDTQEFKTQLQKIASFDSVEGFWKLYCHLKRPSVLENNMNFHLFREGPSNIPMWEAYPRGGCWILKVKKKKESGSSVLGKMWQDMVLAAVGEAFEEPDVVGISLCIRRNEDLMSVWNVDNRNDEIRFRIGEKMKRILDLEPSTIIEYKHHAESMQDMSTFRNAKPYVFAASENP
jgi:translation initiation factor 4E